MERRTLKLNNMKKRETEDGKLYIEGYFARFNEPYEVFEKWIETISPGAFRDFLETEHDVKILWNHNTDVVLGSTAAGTASLEEDEQGLYGVVEINRSDMEAMNCYARISRGDVSGCSFGFDIADQEERIDEDGIYRTNIKKVSPLYEVSPCTFPAYPTTSITARCKEQIAEYKKKQNDIFKQRLLEKLKGVQ